jgi:hypothetical protein
MAMRSPALWLLTAAAAATASLVAGPVAALGVLGGTVGAVGAVLRIDRVRGWLQRAAQRDAQHARREAREVRLEDAGIQTHGLADASALVDRITAASPGLAAHLELEALLDRYVELELVAARCVDVLNRRELPRAVPERSAIRTMIRNRSAALRRTCEAQLADAREELGSIIELLRLLVERIALEESELDDEPLDRRLALLDE